MIETERLILRPFIESDAEDVFEYLKKTSVNCFASMKLNSLEEAKAEMKQRADETEYYFAITLKESGKVIGEIDAYPETAEPHDPDKAPITKLDTFSPCWMLNEAYQGKGYAYEAAKAFFNYLFMKRVQDEFTLIQKIITYPANISVKNLVCVVKGFLKSLYLL